MKIENLRVFLKMHHFNQFEKLDGYFVTPYYPSSYDLNHPPLMVIVYHMN